MLKKNSQNAAKGVYALVPQQDFSKPWTDEKLYAKYHITDKEQAFIDSLIRPMDLNAGGED
jgi:site-specific DNA-methyltransferase (adenine-specific)